MERWAEGEERGVEGGGWGERVRREGRGWRVWREGEENGVAG